MGLGASVMGRRYPTRSDAVRRERVAGAWLAALVAGAEPLGALGRRAVGERVGADRAGRLALEAVVAHGAGGGQGLVDVAGLEVALLVDRVRPDTGVAVGLQLGADREHVGVIGVVAAQARDLVLRAELLLDVVAHLVGD